MVHVAVRCRRNENFCKIEFFNVWTFPILSCRPSSFILNFGFELFMVFTLFVFLLLSFLFSLLLSILISVFELFIVFTLFVWCAVISVFTLAFTFAFTFAFALHFVCLFLAFLSAAFAFTPFWKMVLPMRRNPWFRCFFYLRCCVW